MKKSTKNGVKVVVGLNDHVKETGKKLVWNITHLPAWPAESWLLHVCISCGRREICECMVGAEGDWFW